MYLLHIYVNLVRQKYTLDNQGIRVQCLVDTDTVYRLAQSCEKVNCYSINNILKILWEK
jgi:hypothetical protein